MITGFKVVTKSNSYTLLKPRYTYDLGIQLSALNNTMYVGCLDPVSLVSFSYAPYMGYLNGQNPDALSNMYLLGDMCTSVIDKTLTTDVTCSNSHLLLLFDGCVACSKCLTITKLQSMILNCNIWLNGLKDCQLYYLPGAAVLWDRMILKRIEQSLSSCNIALPVTRDFGKAIRLLYQYKAAVYLWNYLVFTKSGTTLIVEAALSYAGFVARSKRSIDTCSIGDTTSTGTVKLYIVASLLAGQTSLVLKTDGRYLNIYAAQVDLNTSILYYNSERLVSGISEQGILYSPSISQQVSTEIKLLRSPKFMITAVFTFNPLKNCKSIFSGGLKILPVISDTLELLLDISRYIELRQEATLLLLLLQTKKNIWKVLTWWEYQDTGSAASIDRDTSSLIKYYSTGYYTYPSSTISGALM